MARFFQLRGHRSFLLNFGAAAFAAFIVGAPAIAAPATSAPLVQHEFLIASSSQEKIEFYWSKPQGPGPSPLLLLIHPDQDSPKIGGAMFVKSGQLQFWADHGFVAAAISQPGYGSSDGDADFCGPRTQKATLALLIHLQSLKPVDASKVFVYGGSRGAVVAGMLATLQPPGLRGVILKSGVYDFASWWRSRPWYDLIKLTLFWEIGWPTESKLKERSAFYAADRIKAPLLIIHGTEDKSASYTAAEQFSERVRASGGQPQFVSLASGHVIPMPQINGLMESFIRGVLHRQIQATSEMVEGAKP
jgi:dipeptidyl aminopeptidase/acylaminoacyl peptidase